MEIGLENNGPVADNEAPGGTGIARSAVNANESSSVSTGRVELASTTGAGLRVSNLGKLFGSGKGGREAGLHPLSFTLEEGTFFTLLGPSGCGKTTTLRCIAGLQQPDHGTIRLGNATLFDGERGINVPLNRRGIGMVFQSYAIWPHMSIFENVAFPLRVTRQRSYDRAGISSMVNKALDRVDLSGFGPRSPTQLSGGQQQRVALARAIVSQPNLLLLDEPLSNLDARLRDEMRAELKRLQRELGITTVYVTHDQAEALEMSDRIAILDKGHLRQLGTARDIFFEPADAFVANFMGSPNLLHGTVASDVGDHGIGKIVLDDGRQVVCRFPRSLRAGSRAVASVRPEIVSLLQPKSSAPNEVVNTFTGIVVTSGFLGHLTRCDLDIGGQVIQASVNSRIDLQPGSEVVLSFPQDEAVGLSDAPTP